MLIVIQYICIIESLIKYGIACKQPKSESHDLPFFSYQDSDIEFLTMTNSKYFISRNPDSINLWTLNPKHFHSCFNNSFGKHRICDTTYKSVDNCSALAEFVSHHEEKTEIWTHCHSISLQGSKWNLGKFQLTFQKRFLKIHFTYW